MKAMLTGVSLLWCCSEGGECTHPCKCQRGTHVDKKLKTLSSGTYYCLVEGKICAPSDEYVYINENY